MVTAVDSSVLIDVICDDAKFADKSIATIKKARDEGQIIICECVLAEISPALYPTDIASFLSTWDIGFKPSSEETARLAGEFYTLFCKRKSSGHILSDFLVGAHAIVYADRLLTRDKGYYRDYFKKLKILDPSKLS
ncbi:MAG: type II toxin-antitoxin system VapC family toxin [Verrucomicrobiota bacterium]|nr:type II toxin-antitoxin system VapC family toxin [Verrucomicrobiota bacterium]